MPDAPIPRDIHLLGHALRILAASLPHLSAREIVAAAVEGEEPGEQKQMILAARDPDVAVISDDDAEALIRDLGLREA